MDEMTLLRELGRDLAPDDLEPPASLRPRSLPRRSSRRAVLLAAAAAVTVALVVAPALLPGGAERPSAAAAVLDRAAAAAGGTPLLEVPPGGFVFTESVTLSEVDTITDGVEKRELSPLTDRRVWLSAEGDGVGRLSERPHGQRRWGTSSLGVSSTPAYLKDLPTGTSEMLAWLREHSDGPDVLKTVGDTLQETYIPPRSVAALFRAAARIPGTRVIRDERDGLGRPAVAVAVDSPVARQELLFAPSTYAYLGTKTVQRASSDLGPAGTVVTSFSVVRVGATARAGDLP